MLIRTYGGPDVFEAGEVETPHPGSNEVRVRCRASSVNPVDASIRAGMLKSFVWLKLPAVLGVDVADEVVETGRHATRFKRGERVFAFTGIRRGGGYGEYAVVPEAALAIIPSKLSWAEAGSVPGVGATAYEALTERAPLKSGIRLCRDKRVLASCQRVSTTWTKAMIEALRKVIKRMHTRWR